MTLNKIWYFICVFLSVDNLVSRINHDLQNLFKNFRGINIGIILNMIEKINQRKAREFGYNPLITIQSMGIIRKLIIITHDNLLLQKLHQDSCYNLTTY